MVMKLNKISIIIPAYNEEKTIKKVVYSVINSNTLGLKKEIIVVSDGSTDETSTILRKINSKLLRIIINSKNKGKGHALRTGFKKATGDIILIQDADLEYNPKDYVKIIRPFLKSNVKVIYGSREITGKNKHSSVFFHAGGRMVTGFTNLLFNSKLTDVPTGFKVFKKDLLSKINLTCIRFEFCPEVTAKILKKGIHIKEVPITYKARHRSEGKKINWIDGIEAIWTLFKIKFNL